MSSIIRPASEETRHAGRRLRATLLALVVAAALTGCVLDSDTQGPSRSEAATTDAAAPATDPTLSTLREGGTGPTTIQITRPSEEARYLNATFTCSQGSARVELREDPAVSMSGTCGGGQSYQMTLPPGIDELHLDIIIDPESTFEFRGTFTAG